MSDTKISLPRSKRFFKLAIILLVLSIAKQAQAQTVDQNKFFGEQFGHNNVWKLLAGTASLPATNALQIELAADVARNTSFAPAQQRIKAEMAEHVLRVRKQFITAVDAGLLSQDLIEQIEQDLTSAEQAVVVINTDLDQRDALAASKLIIGGEYRIREADLALTLAQNVRKEGTKISEIIVPYQIFAFFLVIIYEIFSRIWQRWPRLGHGWRYLKNGWLRLFNAKILAGRHR